jgi:SagB-type dehydrogenase family enzyme
VALTYHELTKHSVASVRAGAHGLDWPNKPLPFKVYTSLEGIPLPTDLPPPDVSALEAIAGGVQPDPARSVDLHLLSRLLYHANGITKLLRGAPFRAAACTGALYHIELYVICHELPDLDAGVYHYSAHDHALRLLRRGDYRAELGARAPAVIALTSTWWRNAWKYQARAYRHSFWDSGTILANLLAVAAAQHLPTLLRLGFVDAMVNRVLDVDPSHEAAICLVELGPGGSPPPAAPEVGALDLPTRQLSAQQISYPEITAAHAATSLADGTAWPPPAEPPEARKPSLPDALPLAPPIEQVIVRRGSARRSPTHPLGSISYGPSSR